MLLKSQLIEEDQLERLMEEFQSICEGQQSGDLQVFMGFLVFQGVLTPWQMHMISVGKYKGFFLDDYVVEATFYQAGDRRIVLARGESTTAVLSCTWESESKTIDYEVLFSRER